ncbi:MAG: glycosyltransferase family 4 protein [Candidatus Limivicinus sp.]|jgi:glycosyltransferase involved in cell wall biosynthesis
MNITLFISSLYGGGAERVTCSLANYLAGRGHEVEILTMAETENSYQLNGEVSVQALLYMRERKGKLYNNVLRITRLRQYMKKHTEKDVYIVMLPIPTVLLLSLRSATKAKIIASERVSPAAYDFIKTKALRRLAPRADGFVFQTQEALEWYGESVKHVRTAVIPNAINRQFLRPRYKGERKKNIVAAGRLSKQKNFELLIRAFKKITPDCPDYKLIIYGEGGLRKELEALIKENGLEDLVSLPGNTTEIIEKIQDASLFVLSSDYEGMPNALMEAMALGLPCISTDCPCGGPRFLIENGINGLLVPVGDEDKLSEAIKKILNNPQLADKFGTEASKISGRLDPDKIYGQWEAFIKKTAGQR